MPSLQVREVPEAVYGALVEASKRDHRSLSQQTLLTIEKGLGVQGDAKVRRSRLMEAIVDAPVQGSERLPDPVEMVREERRR